MSSEEFSLQNGLVGHWTMDDSDTSNGTLYDSSAYNRNASFNGTINTSKSSYLGEGYDFSNNGYLTAPSTIDPSQGSMSIVATPTTNSSLQYALAQTGSPTNGAGGIQEFAVDLRAPAIFEYFSESTRPTVSAGGSLNVEQHYLFTWENGNKLQAYRDGELINETNIGTLDMSNIENGTDLVISATTNESTTSRFFDGELSDIRLYNRVLSENEVSALYNMRSQRQHNSNTIFVESFENGSFDSKWNVSNATISSTRSFSGNFSFGSFDEGGVEADLVIQPNGYEKIESFEYYWKEFSGQTGHVVILYDQNGNQVQESGTENPQWYLNDGSGGRVEISNSGTNYNVWTQFKFDFDWENGEYDYVLKKTDGTHSDTGTQPLDNSTGVSRIRFTGSGYGSADFNRFDDISINK